MTNYGANKVISTGFHTHVDHHVGQSRTGYAEGGEVRRNFYSGGATDESYGSEQIALEQKADAAGIGSWATAKQRHKAGIPESMNYDPSVGDWAPEHKKQANKDWEARQQRDSDRAAKQAQSDYDNSTPDQKRQYELTHALDPSPEGFQRGVGQPVLGAGAQADQAAQAAAAPANDYARGGLVRRGYAGGGEVRRNFVEGGESDDSNSGYTDYTRQAPSKDINKELDAYYKDPLEGHEAKLKPLPTQDDDTIYGSTKPKWSEDAYNASQMQASGYARGGLVRRRNYDEGGDVASGDNTIRIYEGSSTAGSGGANAPAPAPASGGGPRVEQGISVDQSGNLQTSRHLHPAVREAIKYEQDQDAYQQKAAAAGVGSWATKKQIAKAGLGHPPKTPEQKAQEQMMAASGGGYAQGGEVRRNYEEGDYVDPMGAYTGGGGGGSETEAVERVRAAERAQLEAQRQETEQAARADAERQRSDETAMKTRDIEPPQPPPTERPSPAEQASVDNAPPTGYGGRGAADIAAQQADENRRAMAARAPQGASEFAAAGQGTGRPPEVEGPSLQPSFDEKAAAAPSVRDVLDYTHKKFGLDTPTPTEAEPPTGYGGQGPSDIAARQADEQRRTMAGRSATEGMTPLSEMSGRSDIGTLAGGVARKGIEGAAGAVGDFLTKPTDAPKEAIGKFRQFADKAAEPSQASNAVAAYLRGDHAAPQQAVTAQLEATAKTNPDLTPAEVAVKAVTDPKLDPDQQASILGGMQQRYQLTNAMAQGAIAHNDVQGAMRLATEAHNHVPDGQNLSFRQEGDRVIATVDPLGQRPPVSYSMTMQQFHDYLVGPATSFDHVVVNGVQKNLEIASGGAIVRPETGYTEKVTPGNATPTSGTGQPVTGYGANQVEPSNQSAFGPGERVPTPQARPNTKEAQAIRPWGGNLTDPEVGPNKEATRELGGRGDSPSKDIYGKPIPGTSAHKPAGAGAFYRDETLIRTPQYTQMMLDQGAKPIIDQRGYTRGWQTRPGNSDFDTIPQSAYTAKPGTIGTPRADGSYDANPLPRYSPGTSQPAWDPDKEGQPSQRAAPAWQPQYGRGTAGPPPPADDQSADARAARMYPSTSDARHRGEAAAKFRSEDEASTLKREEFASKERIGETSSQTRADIAALKAKADFEKQQLRGTQGSDLQATKGSQRLDQIKAKAAEDRTLQEQKDLEHANRQQNWINFRTNKTAQEIEARSLNSREQAAAKMYDEYVRAGMKPPPEAQEAADKLLKAVNSAGFQTPPLPHADVGAAASQAASTAASGQVQATPSASIPAQPSNVPPGSSYSPSRQQWRTPDGKVFNADGSPAR